MAIAASFCGCMVIGFLDIEAIIEATNCLYIIAVTLEFAAFLALRLNPPPDLASGARSHNPCSSIVYVAIVDYIDYHHC